MKIAVLASGGVDSTVAQFLLKEQGHDLTAFYLKVWMEDDTTWGECPWQEDLDYVFQIGQQLNIPVEVVSMQKEYWNRVVDYTIETVKSGATPNPDMMCNRLVKFGAFQEKFGHEFDKIATGHWAKLKNDVRERTHLYLGKDRFKDQTYFLSQMTCEQISHALFPLGDYTKPEIREMARRQNFPNAKRKDSQGICFLGRINYRDFIRKYLGEKPGLIIDKESGAIIGEHKGIWFHTIGQRQGLGLGNGPWFVIEKDQKTNTVYVAKGYDPEAVYQQRIPLAQFNWINRPEDFISGSFDIHFKIRHTPELLSGQLLIQNGTITILAREPVHGVAAGQFGVIYRETECLGGGTIVT
ncbi:tRNA 2-thiouridine(34) synthase MnmA [candidate division KSB1 bacterium]|nr:tRNA 2-thiouridine(34) synthase MnmA [candidate division KSB1 bacterium]